MLLQKPAKGTARKEQRQRRRTDQELDWAGNALVVERATRGRYMVCEARVKFGDFLEPACGLPGTIIHHCLGGIGRRGKGDSALAVNKLVLCQSHNDQLHVSGRIRQVGAPGGPWWFERVA